MLFLEKFTNNLSPLRTKNSKLMGMAFTTFLNVGVFGGGSDHLHHTLLSVEKCKSLRGTKSVSKTQILKRSKC